MSDDSNAPVDLSKMEMDLSQIFRPSWTVESSDTTARLAAKFDHGDRGDRGERSGGGRGRDGQGRGPSRDRDSRGPRSQSPGGNKDARGPQQGGTRGNRDASRGQNSRDRRQDDRRPEPVQKPALEGWKLELLPEASALEGIAKQIRSRAKTYPLFELARLIIQLSDRYSVGFKAEAETSPELFLARLDGSVWTSRREAIAHLLAKHLGKFYRASAITIEAPKGSYSVVAQCGMSGVLLGPPNHHEYQSRLLGLHAAGFKNLPFEVYKTRIKMMRDDALMEQWKSEQSTRTVYIPIDPNEAKVIEELSAETDSLATPESAAEEITPSIVEGEEIAAPAETVEASESSDEVPAEESAPAVEEKGLTLEEATAHFHAHHAANEVEPAGTQFKVPGRIALHDSDPLVRELLLRTLQEMDHFPLPLAQVLGKELTGSGLQIFKAQKKIHVSMARPRYLDRATTPTSEGFRKILDYLEAHPNQVRDKQWAGLLAQITEPAGDDAEAIQRREQILGTDLLSLLHQGHILDFAMGNLQAALRPVPKPTAPAKNPKTKSESPAAIPSVSATPSESLSEIEEESELVEEILVESESVESQEVIAETVSEPLVEDSLIESGAVKSEIVEEPLVERAVDEEISTPEVHEVPLVEAPILPPKAAV